MMTNKETYMTPSPVKNAKRVQVRDIRGKLIYRDLLDDGSNVLRFDRGGFLTRDQIERERWTLEPLDNSPGWQARQGWRPVWKGEWR